jgi:hypothetical protein
MKLFSRKRDDAQTIPEWTVRTFLSGGMNQGDPRASADALLDRLRDNGLETAVGAFNMAELENAMDACRADWQERGIEHGDIALLLAYVTMCERIYKDKSQGVNTLQLPPESFVITVTGIREGLVAELDRQLDSAGSEG